MNPTIEQTVKAIETGIEKLCKLGNGEHDGNSDGNVIAQSLRQHLTSLRALTEPSKTDEELARELYSTLETLPNNDTTYPYEEYKQSAIHSITQAFTAIRAQARSEALLEVQMSCANRRAAFILSKDKAEKAGLKNVVDCRQSDIETLEWVLETIRKLKANK